MILRPFFLSQALLACSTELDDADRDGYSIEEGDCDDNNPGISPVAIDLAGDQTDQNCDGADGIDSDGDGVGSDAWGGQDCDDADASVYPGADDVWYDGVDSDCDGEDDYDSDGDGHALDAYGGGDCDDTDASIHPEASEWLLDGDFNCDGEVGGSLANAEYAFLGGGGGDLAGHAVASAGDVDGDGRADLLIGAYGNDVGGRDAGKTYLILGGRLGPSRTIELYSADHSFIGEEGYSLKDLSVSGAGDVDGDGLDDILVGATYTDSETSRFAGTAYLLLGGSLGASSMNLADADIRFVASDDSDIGGRSVSGAGDVNGDGIDDLLIGTQSNNSGSYDYAGQAYLILDAGFTEGAEIDLADADTRLVGSAEDDHAGHSVSGAGDVDGDGLADLLIGAHENDDAGMDAGKASLVLGGGLGDVLDLGDADYTFIGEDAYDSAGRSVSGAGDVDGDGRSDVLVGAPFSDQGGYHAGKVYVILGGSLSTSTFALADADHGLAGDEPEDYAGYSVADGGDVDGDGRADILIGAPSYAGAGSAYCKAYMVRSSDLGPAVELADVDYGFVGEERDDEAGTSLSGAGDVDGDGRSDLLIGAPSNDDRGDDAGKVHLLLSLL